MGMQAHFALMPKSHEEHSVPIPGSSLVSLLTHWKMP